MGEVVGLERCTQPRRRVVEKRRTRARPNPGNRDSACGHEGAACFPVEFDEAGGDPQQAISGRVYMQRVGAPEVGGGSGWSVDHEYSRRRADVRMNRAAEEFEPLLVRAGAQHAERGFGIDVEAADVSEGEMRDLPWRGAERFSGPQMRRDRKSTRLNSSHV